MKFVQSKTLIKQGLRLYPDLCPRSRSPKSSCQICENSCPLGAVSLTKSIEVRNSCIECGICTAACPNGVFELADRDDMVLVEEIKMKTGRLSVDRISFKCAKTDESETGAICVTCLSRLTESVLLTPFQLGARTVELLHYDCTKCFLQRPAFNFLTTLKLMDVLMPAAGLERERIIVRQMEGPPPYAGDVTPQRPKEPLSRRDFLSFFKKRLLSEISAPSEELPEDSPKRYSQLNHRRARLLKVLKSFRPWNPVIVKNGSLPFGEAEITNDCIGCRVCEKICSVCALKSSIKDGMLTITFSQGLCTRCGLCEEVCIAKAIGFRNSFELNDLPAVRTKNLISLPEKKCALCKQPFYGSNESVCYFCLKTDILSG